MIIFYAINFFTSIIFFLMGLCLQTFADNSIFLGVRIPLGYSKDERLQKELKNYKKRWSLTWGIIFIASLLLTSILKEEIYGVIIFLVFIFAQLIFLQICYYISFKRVKEIKKQENWKELLTDKKVVYVDLNLKKEVEKSMNKALYYIPWIIYLISLAIPILKNKQIHIVLLISGISALAILQLSILGVLKTKQNLNGGNLEDIKKEALSSKKTILKLLYGTQILIAILFGISNLFIAGTLSSNIAFIISFIVIISTVIISIISTLTILKRRESIRNLSEKDFNEKGQIILNKDDDDNYLMGMIYYNPNDPSLLVNKRMGVGMSFNFANPIAKVINIALVILVVSVFAIVINLSISTTTVEFKNTSVEISCMYSNEINYKDIDKVEYLEKAPKVGIKINGASIGNKHIGYYSMSNNENAKLYIEDVNKPCVFIKLKDGKNIYFNYQDETKTRGFYKTLKNYWK